MCWFSFSFIYAGSFTHQINNAELGAVVAPGRRWRDDIGKGRKGEGEGDGEEKVKDDEEEAQWLSEWKGRMTILQHCQQYCHVG